jgi:hypothetical protein
MTRYAQFDPTVSSPSPVVGWYDTDEFDYPKLPAAKGLLQLTDEQWLARVENPSGWAVSDGELIPFTPIATPLS